MTTPEITPVPSDEEAAAVVAAVEAFWPRPGTTAPIARSSSTAWRFSGRWWHRDRFATVDRPWT